MDIIGAIFHLTKTGHKIEKKLGLGQNNKN